MLNRREVEPFIVDRALWKFFEFPCPLTSSIITFRFIFESNMDWSGRIHYTAGQKLEWAPLLDRQIAGGPIDRALLLQTPANRSIAHVITFPPQRFLLTKISPTCTQRYVYYAPAKWLKDERGPSVAIPLTLNMLRNNSWDRRAKRTSASYST